LYKHNGYYLKIDLNNQEEIEGYAYEFNCDEEELVSVINYCIERKLFNKEI
jgi:hypothetical protein